MGQFLPRDFYARDTVEVAQALLGQRLVRVTPEGEITGLIVEVEAYLPVDPASHAHRGPSRRNAAMFGPPGHAYVYTIHTRFCLNAVTEPENQGAAVLIRAVEPERGRDLMAARRGMHEERQLARGPGRLCEAFGLDLQWNHWDLTQGDQVWLERGPKLPSWRLGISPRIGIRQAADWPLRFFVLGHSFVSGLRRTHQGAPPLRWTSPNGPGR